MTRGEYIAKVKLLLDEVSPFDEPVGFIASGGDSDYAEVKPVVSYIDGCLDRAATFCLNELPTTLLQGDIVAASVIASLDADGVGHVQLPTGHYIRPVRLRDNEGVLQRDITAFISTSSPLYLLQQNRHTRGKTCKPVASYSPESGEIEIFSYYNGDTCRAGDVRLGTTLYYIDSLRKAEDVVSPIAEYIALICASYVEEILGDSNAAQVFQSEYKNRLGVGGI